MVRGNGAALVGNFPMRDADNALNLGERVTMCTFDLCWIALRLALDTFLPTDLS